jgi:hypothetical protein
MAYQRYRLRSAVFTTASSTNSKKKSSRGGVNLAEGIDTRSVFFNFVILGK